MDLQIHRSVVSENNYFSLVSGAAGQNTPLFLLHLGLMYCRKHSNYRGGFLIRRSSAIRRFIAGFLTCDNRTIMKSFLKKIAGELIGNLHKNPPKFPENSRAIFLRNDFIIVRLSHVRNPAIYLRIAELRLMRNPPQINRRMLAAREWDWE